jgi:Fe-S-cluster containining protein
VKIIDGKPFECTRCGDCCRWEGHVYLTPEDTRRLSQHQGIALEEYLRDYTEQYGSSLVLKNKGKGTKECIYLEDNECSINSIKPKQCAEYPTKYEVRCPGFKHTGRTAMSKYDEVVSQMNDRFSSLQGYEKEVSDNLFRDLKKNVKASTVATKALVEGIDDYFNVDRIKIASLDDLFSFNRVDANTLVHKSTKDLWGIDKDSSGKVVITRLFSNDGEPIKG